MKDFITTTRPPHEQNCCTPRAHVLLFVELAETAQHDPELRNLLPFARRFLFGQVVAR